MRRRVCGASLVNSTLWSVRCGNWYSPALCRTRYPALRHLAVGISLERFLERYQPPADRHRHRACSRSGLPRIFKWSCRTSHKRCGFPGSLRNSMVAAPSPSQEQQRLVRRKYVQAIAEDRTIQTDRAVCFARDRIVGREIPDSIASTAKSK